jgi:hypothetical protein
VPSLLITFQSHQSISFKLLSLKSAPSVNNFVIFNGTSVEKPSLSPIAPCKGKIGNETKHFNNWLLSAVVSMNSIFDDDDNLQIVLRKTKSIFGQKPMEVINRPQISWLIHHPYIYFNQRQTSHSQFIQMLNENPSILERMSIR